MSTVLLVIIVVAVAVLLLRKPLSSGSGQLSYRRKSYLLSKAERSFYGVLSQAVVLACCRVEHVNSPRLVPRWEMGDLTRTP